MRKIVIWAFLFNVFFAGNVFADTFGNITVTEMQQTEPLLNARTYHGYTECRFLVQNSDTVPHKIKIDLEPSIYGRGGISTLRYSTDVVEVSAGGREVLRVLQPPVRFYGGGDQKAIVRIDGWAQNPMSSSCIHMNDSGAHAYTGSGSGVKPSTALFSQQTPAAVRDFFLRRTTKQPDDGSAKTPPTTGSHTHTSTYSTPMTPMTPMTTTTTVSPAPTIAVQPVNSWLSNVPVDEWSDAWISYSRFDCVVITNDEWNGLVTRKPTVLVAIKRYVEVGGVLVVLGKDWEVPAEWKPIKKQENSNPKLDVVCGNVFVLGRTGTEVAENASVFDDVIKTIDTAAVAENSRLDLAQHINYSYYHTYNSGESTTARMHNVLPVVKEYGVNVRLVLVLIIVFAVLIGPVNIFVLQSINRRIWLIWTVPATSLIASLIVLLTSFLNEGLLRQASSMTCTVLDQRRGVATSFGFVGYYSTFSPGAIKFSSDIELLPFFDSNSGTVELQLDSSGNQVLSGGWILPRVPAYFSLRKSQLQQKLNVTFNWSDPQKPTATNGLGIKINNLTVCSPTGEFFEANTVEAGEQKILTRVASPVSKVTEASFYNDLRDRQKNSLSNSTDFLTGQQHAKMLFPNSYSAESSDWNPFIDKGLPNLNNFEHKTRIIGIYQ
ncbi:MAG: hypothetical protein LBJ00_17990 [Planctomycetaceae bacterium]|nr:hypothetical protein [Planctomycetaceae bacterium]